MQKEYTFEFAGTKEDFLDALNAYYHYDSYSGGICYYFDDFIVKKMDDAIHFGVERQGHSGGSWYIPSITEYEGRIELCGTIQYVGPYDDRGKIRKAIGGIEYFLLLILLLPIALVIRVYWFAEWLIRKLLKRPKQKVKTTEDKLFDLMETHLGCIRK